MKTKLFILLFAIGASVGTMFASNTQVNGIWYDFNENSKTASVSYKGSEYYSYSDEYVGSISIPSTVIYDNITYSVTSIKWNAFHACSNLTSVTIPNSVTSIGYSAFYGCSALTSITIGESVSNIGTKAFDYCSNLTSITINSNSIVNGSSSLINIFGSRVKKYIIGESVTSIGNSVFSGCTSLTSITIPESVTSIGNSVFSGCTSLTSITIPESVTSIGNSVFSGCTSLTSITIPNSVTSIGNSVFSGCTSLTSITIPNSVTSIGENAFNKCTGLTSITIPESVTSVGAKAFVGCSNLNSIVWNAKSCSNFTYDNTPFFDLKSQITSFIFGEKVETIPAYLCGFMRNLTSITISESVTSIGNYAFYGCSGLTCVTIGESVTSIGENAFGGCSGLTCVTIGESVTSIGNYAFYGCSGLTCVTIGESVTSIGENAFGGCSVLTSITIPESVTSIGENAFNECTGLTYVIIGNSVTSIGVSAFNGCTSLTEVHIKDIAAWCKINFGNYNSNPLNNAHNLYLNDELATDLIIPNNVTSIGKLAFYNCTCLTSVTILNSVTNIGESAFYGCSSLTSITIPNSVTSIGSYAFSSCSGLTAIYVPCGELNRFKEMLNNDSRVKYVPLEYQITILPTDHGEVEIPTICDDTILTAIADYGYHFVQWNDGNTDNPRKIILTQDTTFSAIFAPNKYSINDSSNKDRGYIKGAGSYDYDSKITIEAVPNYGYHLIKWSDMVDSVYNVDEIPSNAISLTKAREIASGLSSWESTSQKYTIYGYITDFYPGYSNSYIISENPDNGVSFVIFKAANSANIGDFVYVTAYLYNYKGTLETEQGGVITKISKKYVIPSNPRTIVLDRDTIIEAVFAPNKYVIQGNTDISRGHIEGTGSFDYLSNQTLTAVNEHGYCFKQWSDGNTDNPRTIVLTKDTVFTAIFDYATTGYCGDDYALTWVYNREDKALTISGTGKLNSNYDFGLEAPLAVEKLIIDDGVTSIGEAAFKNFTTLTSVSLAASVKTIYEQAFYNCLNLQNFYCFREYPSVVYNNTFEGVDKFECTLHVPSTSIDMYKAATGWRDFYFIIGNSDPSTSVDYTSADQSKATKILCNGQILILHGDKTYSITGQEVR